MQNSFLLATCILCQGLQVWNRFVLSVVLTQKVAFFVVYRQARDVVGQVIYLLWRKFCLFCPGLFRNISDPMWSVYQSASPRKLRLLQPSAVLTPSRNCRCLKCSHLPNPCRQKRDFVDLVDILLSLNFSPLHSQYCHLVQFLKLLFFQLASLRKLECDDLVEEACAVLIPFGCCNHSKCIGLLTVRRQKWEVLCRNSFILLNFRQYILSWLSLGTNSF